MNYLMNPKWMKWKYENQLHRIWRCHISWMQHSQKLIDPLNSTRVGIFLLGVEMLRTVDFDISFKICPKSAWKWGEISFLETITSSDARIRIPWQNIESRLYTLSTSLGCCSIDIRRYPSSLIFVSLQMVEFKRDTPVDGQYFNLWPKLKCSVKLVMKSFGSFNWW